MFLQKAFQSIMKQYFHQLDVEKKSICNLSFTAQLSDTLRVAFDFSLILKKPINQNKYCIDI